MKQGDGNMGDVMVSRVREAERQCLLINNWDSFTQNVCDLLQRVSGRIPVQLNNNEPLSILKHYMDLVDFIVLSPGPGHPGNDADFGINADVLRQAAAPILGICLGMQGMALYHGASISCVEDPRHGYPRQVYHSGTHPLFSGIPSPFDAVCYNSLSAVDCPPGVSVIAWTEQPYSIMAIDCSSLSPTGSIQLGLQFHPESFRSCYGAEIIANFLRYYVGDRALHRNPLTADMAPRPILRAPSISSPTLVKPVSRVALTHSQIPLPNGFDIAAFFHKIRSDQPTGAWNIWLDSAIGGSVSYLAVGGGDLHHTLLYNQGTRRLSDSRLPSQSDYQLPPQSSFFDIIQAELDSISLVNDDSSRPLPFEFVGGYAGYFGYEMKAECGSCDPNQHTADDQPTAAFTFVDRLVVVQHDDCTIHFVACARADEPQRSSLEWADNLKSLIANVDNSKSAHAIHDDESSRQKSKRVFSSRDQRDQYLHKVQDCLDFIASGDSYELCLTTQFQSIPISDTFSLYRDLRVKNPAPFAAYFEAGSAVTLCCSSPERFLRVDQRGQVTCQPIKGTGPRSTDEGVDRQYRDQLRNSPKDQAENLMITDLIRHDLSLSCLPQTVRVDRFCQLESFAHVHQLISTVSGRIRPELSPLRCIQSAFPPGHFPDRHVIPLLDRPSLAPLPSIHQSLS